jgi:hypothetical protein
MSMTGSSKDFKSISDLGSFSTSAIISEDKISLLSLVSMSLRNENCENELHGVSE